MQTDTHTVAEIVEAFKLELIDHSPLMEELLSRQVWQEYVQLAFHPEVDKEFLAFLFECANDNLLETDEKYKQFYAKNKYEIDLVFKR